MPRTDSGDPRGQEPVAELTDAEVVTRLRWAIAAADLRLWDWDLETDLGQGSRFVVALTTATAPEPVPGTDLGAPPPAPSGPLSRVLVVDDNRDVVTTLGLVFELEGHEVRRAYEGEGALAVAREFRPDFVLFDLGLPGCSGYEVCRHLRREPWGQEPFVVALTGWGQDDDKRRTSEAGFDLHLVKPVLPEVLLELVREAHGMRKTSSV